MNMTQLRAFYEVAVHGSFTKAARGMRLTQPGLSGHVKALEDRYEVELLLRKPSGVSLTEPGRELFVSAEQIFRLCDEAETRLETAASVLSGVLKVGSDNPYRAMACLSDFVAQYGQVKLDLRFGNGAQVLDDLRNCIVDVAFLAQSEGHPKESSSSEAPDLASKSLGGLYAVKRGRQAIDVVVSVTHPWSRKKSLRLEQLHGKVMLRRERGSKTQDAFDRKCRETKVVPAFSMEIDSREGLREAIASGLGIGVLCRAEHDHDPRLHAIRLRECELFLTEYVACVRTRKEAPLIQRVIDFAQHFDD
jgi:DNA-binding transcriptional LysR family regulator